MKGVLARKLKVVRKKIAEVSLVIVSIFICSYMVNFIWESFHAVFLYDDHDFNARKYVLMVSYVSAVDGFLILGIYLLIAALWRDVTWIREINGKQICAVLLAGLLLAAAIEFRKVFMTRTWNYNRLVPTFFWLGLSPLLQLSITGLWAFWLSGRVMYQRDMSGER